MGTSIVKYHQKNDLTPCWGVLSGKVIHKINLDFMDHKDLMNCYLNDRTNFDSAIEDTNISQNSVTFHSPISRNIQLFAQGVNYIEHREEGGLKTNGDEEASFFAKSPSSISGPNDDIVRPEDCELLDYEIELGILLKKELHKHTKVTDDTLGDYIGGLFLSNDVSSRDNMFGAPMMQWYRGKSHRTFCPIGPVLYLLDKGDISQLYNLQLTLKMNGKVRQDSVTSQLMHKPPKALTDLSEFTDVHVGDCVLTGTPGGVIGGKSLKTMLAVLLNFKNDKKRREKLRVAQKSIATFLQPGDVLELEIKSLDGSIDLGRQTNTIVQA